MVLGVLLAVLLADADAVGEADAVAVGPVVVGPVVVGPVVDGRADEAGVPLRVADGLAETGVLGASWVHAAMTTRSLAGSALPPTPLRSTK